MYGEILENNWEEPSLSKNTWHRVIATAADSAGTGAQAHQSRSKINLVGRLMLTYMLARIPASKGLTRTSNLSNIQLSLWPRCVHWRNSSREF